MVGPQRYSLGLTAHSRMFDLTPPAIPVGGKLTRTDGEPPGHPNDRQ